jgi:hypothetical protein
MEGCHFFKKLLEDRTTGTGTRYLRIALLAIVERTESVKINLKITTNQFSKQ